MHGGVLLPPPGLLCKCSEFDAEITPNVSIYLKYTSTYVYEKLTRFNYILEAFSSRMSSGRFLNFVNDIKFFTVF